MRALHEDVKIDQGLPAQALNNTNVTGRYFPLAQARRVLAILSGGAMAATKTTIVELLQAQDHAGTGAKGIPTTVGQLATVTVTANALVAEATVTLATFLATGTITINGLVFTAHATVTTYADREFKIDGSDTQDGDELVLCINHATYGVPGVTAENAAGVVTLISTIPGEKTITVETSPDDGTCVKATVSAQAFVEAGAASLDLAGGFSHVGVKITTTADSVVAASLLRGRGRYAPPVQSGELAKV